ncbi:MAG: response regulator transcription factor [Planctomycetota bacterium]|nr:MAG: response regulator transcription factor [Planctomycetota bacterium]
MVRKKIHDEASENKSKILIVDDHPIVRQGLAELINQEKDLTVCGQAEDAHQAMQAIRSLKPDIVVVDILLKQTSGMELIKDINVRYPNLAILALSMHEEFLYAERALRAGAKGYIMKAEATEKVIIAIRKVLSGDIYLSEPMAAKIIHKLVGGGADVGTSAIDRLSDRELEVFHLVGQGYRTQQIAEKLHLSVKTIETYRAHIKEKLNLTDAAELLQYAIRWVTSQDKE